MAKFTIKQGRAIQAYLDRGYRLQMNNGPGGINFEHKTTGKVEQRTLDELLEWYDEDQKEKRRQARADKKAEKGTKRRYA